MEKTKGLDFSEPLIITVLAYSFQLGMGLYLTYAWFNGFICAWLIVLFGTVNLLLSTPNITILDDGLLASRFGIRHFISWDRISRADLGRTHSRIYYRGIPLFMRILFFYNSFLVFGWRNNYKEAVKIINDKTQL